MLTNNIGGAQTITDEQSLTQNLQARGWCGIKELTNILIQLSAQRLNCVGHAHDINARYFVINGQTTHHTKMLDTKERTRQKNQ